MLEPFQRRRLIRGVLILVGIYVAFEAGRVLLISFPEFYFGYREEHAFASVSSDVPFDIDTASFVADLEERAAFVPILKVSKRQNVFLAREHSRFAFIAQVAGQGANAQGLSLPWRNNVVVSRTFVEHIGERFGDDYRHTMLAGDLVQVTLHEIVHNATAEQLGWLAFRGLPPWKREGYAEYTSNLWSVAQDPDDDFRVRARRMLAQDYLANDPVRRFYARSQILVEYLAEVRGLSFSEIMDDGMSQKDVLAEVESWLQ